MKKYLEYYVPLEILKLKKFPKEVCFSRILEKVHMECVWGFT